MHQNTNMNETPLHPPSEYIGDTLSTGMCPSYENTIDNRNDDSSSIISEDVSRINLTSDDTSERKVALDAIYNSQKETQEQQKQAWDKIDNSIMKDSIDDEEQNDFSDDFPFFLKEIDISSDILKSDPNEGKDTPPESNTLETYNPTKSSKITGSNISASHENSNELKQYGNVIQNDNVLSNQTPTNSMENIERVKSPFFLKQIDISGEVMKSNPVEIAAQSVKNSSKTSSLKRESIGSSSVTTTNIEKTSKITGSNISASHENSNELKQYGNVLQNDDVLSNQTPTNSVENIEKVKSPFFLKQIDISGEIMKSNPVEIAAQSAKNSSKTSSLKRESTGSSSLTITNIEKSGSQASILSRESSASEDYASNIRVVVRVRPLSIAERQRGDKHCIKFPGGGGIQVEGANQSKAFTFNSVLTEKCTQEEVFEESGIRNLIDKAIDGFSCTVFAFGPTGSGKTHTIIGPSEQFIEDMLDNQDICGLVVRSFRYLFEAADKRSSVQYIIKASFLEVYNEKVKDLLNPSNAYDSLPVRWSSKKGFYVENLFSVECESSQDLMALLVEGSNYRQVGVHAINEHSSRSHTILTVYLESEEVDSDDEEGFPIIRHGKISFIDLAGSERVKETKTTVDTLAESNNINKSLLVLGNCISALGDPKKRGYHVPYRDSKLTKLLADSLGGEGFTLMIACISPSLQNCQDSMNALRYANRAKDIKNKPMVKMDPKEQLLQRMKREIKLLRTENNYFRQQQGVPCSESQIIITPNEIEGELTPNSSGVLSPAIGSGTLSSLHSSRNNSSKELNLTPHTALYALGGKNGLYDILQEYMNENESLKAENMELHRSRAVAHRQQEEMFRENERLARKLDELGRVMLASPISRENVRVWINEGNDGSVIFSPSQGEISAPVKGKPENVKFPPVRQGSYPNYVTVDISANVEHEKQKFKNQGSSLENKPSEELSNKKKSQTNTEKNSGAEAGKTLNNSEKKSNTDQLPKSNIIKPKINTSLKHISMGQSDKEDIHMSNKENKKGNTQNIEDQKDADKNDESSVKPINKKEAIKVKRNYQQKPWKTKKKPTSVEKPCSYAAQFAARKGHAPKQTTQSQEIIPQSASDGNQYQASVIGTVSYSSQPSPYHYASSQPTSYMNTPIYNYNPGYPYPYMGLTPSQVSGLPITAYENMANQLQQDLESLNGHLRTDVNYQHKNPRPPR